MLAGCTGGEPWTRVWAERSGIGSVGVRCRGSGPVGGAEMVGDSHQTDSPSEFGTGR